LYPHFRGCRRILFLVLGIIQLSHYYGVVNAFPAYMLSGSSGCQLDLDTSEVIMNQLVVSAEHSDDPHMHIAVQGHVPDDNRRIVVSDDSSSLPQSMTLQVVTSTPHIQDYQFIVEVDPEYGHFVNGGCDDHRRIAGRNKDSVTLVVTRSGATVWAGWSMGHEAVRLTPALTFITMEDHDHEQKEHEHDIHEHDEHEYHEHEHDEHEHEHNEHEHDHDEHNLHEHDEHEHEHNGHDHENKHEHEYDHEHEEEEAHHRDTFDSENRELHDHSEDGHHPDEEALELTDHVEHDAENEDHVHDAEFNEHHHQRSEHSGDNHPHRHEEEEEDSNHRKGSTRRDNSPISGHHHKKREADEHYRHHHLHVHSDKGHSEDPQKAHDEKFMAQTDIQRQIEHHRKQQQQHGTVPKHDASRQRPELVVDAPNSNAFLPEWDGELHWGSYFWGLGLFVAATLAAVRMCLHYSRQAGRKGRREL
jgi:hypothetical protein